MKRALGYAGLLAMGLLPGPGRFAVAGVGVLPTEPMEIGAEPQFFVDDYVLDNRGAVRQKTEEVLRVFHSPKKHDANRLFAGDSVAHEITWREKTMDSLKGQVIRIEFLLKNADLYTFRASGDQGR